MIRRLAHWAGVTVLTLALLAVPTVTFVYVKHRVQLGQQVTPPVLGPAPAFAPASPSFLVLGYHDLVENLPPAGPAPGRRVSVTARAFAAHLRMLRAAGYTSVSAGQVADHVAGHGALPPRAVLISFDGARWRAWSHADPILAAYGFRAVIFVDPPTVRARRGVTLSWPALRRMAGSGRWSVGVAGTRTTVTTGADGPAASALLAYRWLPGPGRAETSGEFADRVGGMLRAQRRAVVDQGLPDPKLFSYPFQPRYPLTAAGSALDDLTATVAANFTAGVLTMASDEPVRPGWLAKRVLPRMEVYSTTTDEILHHRVRDAASR